MCVCVCVCVCVCRAAAKRANHTGLFNSQHNYPFRTMGMFSEKLWHYLATDTLFAVMNSQFFEHHSVQPHLFICYLTDRDPNTSSLISPTVSDTVRRKHQNIPVWNAPSSPHSHQKLSHCIKRHQSQCEIYIRNYPTASTTTRVSVKLVTSEVIAPNQRHQSV